MREAQVEVAESDPRGAWMNADDLNDRKVGKAGPINDLHYTPT